MKIPNFLPTLKHPRGQSLLELAISLTVILMLLSGAVDFGMAFFSYTALRDAAQEGAVYGSYAPSDVAGIVNHVRKASTNPVNLADTSRVRVDVSWTNGVTKACEGSTNGTTNSVAVNVRYTYPIIMPFLGLILGSQTIPLDATVTDTILAPLC
jgi:Flp pilus assembly protein TadG